MLIDKPAPVAFDFGGQWKESLSLLENEIMYTSGRTYYPFTDPDGELLISLLHRQCIRVFSQKYELEHKDTQEDYQEAQYLAGLIGKRNAFSMLQGLRVYREHKPLEQRNEYNALYYPDLKIYVRFGDLNPAKLLAMLGEEQCNAVVLFRDCADSSTLDRFFIFALGISKDGYRAVMEEEQSRRDEALFAALQAVRERTESIIPDPAIWDSGEEI